MALCNDSRHCALILDYPVVAHSARALFAFLSPVRYLALKISRIDLNQPFISHLVATKSRDLVDSCTSESTR